MIALNRIGGPQVVAEHEKRGAERPHVRQRHAVRAPRPCRARECRSGSCGRRSCPARSRRAVEVRASWSTGPDRPSRRSARARCLATALSTLPDEMRLAMPLASAGKFGRSASQPLGSSRCSASLATRRPGRDAAWHTRRTASPTRRAASCRGLPTPSRKCSRTSSGTRNLASSGQP